VQTCIWPSWCHCHSLSLASVKSRLVLPFWYRLTRIVQDKGPLNVCVRVFVCVCVHAMICLQCFDTVGWAAGRVSIQPVKNRVVGCWCGCLSGARCRLAYGPAGASATHCLLLQQNPDWFYLSGTGQPRVVPDKGPLNVCVGVCARIYYLTVQFDLLELYSIKPKNGATDS